MEEIAREREWQPSFIRFNGATAMKPWKSQNPAGQASQRQWLQWGHGDEAVEEPESHRKQWLAANALQWGHGDEAVEEPAAGTGLSPAP